MFNRSAVCGAVLAAGIIAAGIGCQSKQEDRKVIRVVRNIGGREGFRLHWEAWKEAFERDNPGWSLELINVGDNNGTSFYQTRRQGMACGRAAGIGDSPVGCSGRCSCWG